MVDIPYLLEVEREKKKLNLHVADSDTVFGYFKFRRGQVKLVESVSVCVCWRVHVGASTQVEANTLQKQIIITEHQ